MSSTTTLALFDFDGTLTNKDSAVEFIKFTHPKNWWWKILWLSPILVGVKTGLLDEGPSKQKVLKAFYKGWSKAQFEAQAQVYTERILSNIVRQDGLAQIKEHQAKGHRVLLVSASCEEWLSTWAKKQGMELVATRMEYEQGKFTGKLQGLNCKGPEKVRRVKELLNLADFSSIYAYGDTSGDREMLAIATHPHYRHFNQ